MRPGFLDVLRCPFCGGPLLLGPEAVRDEASGAINAGILNCDCCAHPVVDGIPCMRTGPAADAAMELIGAGRAGDALLTMLGVAEDRRGEIEALRRGERSFRHGLTVLGGDADTSYLLFRFSDPTFLVSDALVRSLAPAVCRPGDRVLDLCGGAGHLTRSAAIAVPECELVLADISFWQLWLGNLYVAPAAQPVWCDANQPLPFAEDAFKLLFCSDAFHYIWERRALAREIAALVGDDGVALLPHLHNALSWNYSEGMPLDPARYRALFAPLHPRLVADEVVLGAVLGGGPLELERDYPDMQLSDAPALTLIAAQADRGLRREEAPRASRDGELRVNPLYEEMPAADGEQRTFVLSWPSEGYRLEYGEAIERYLPRRVDLADDELKGAAPSERLDALLARRIVLGLPARYL